MATEYGYQHGVHAPVWGRTRTQEEAESIARANENVVVVAREVSEPRIVSIRA